MTFNPDFWEVQVDQNILDQFSLEQNPHYETEEDVQARLRQREWTSRLMPLVLNLMDEVLTPRQREIVQLLLFQENDRKRNLPTARHLSSQREPTLVW